MAYQVVFSPEALDHPIKVRVNMNQMTYKGYTAQMEFDTEDKIIVGRVIDIDDIITFHGASIVEFETAMQTAAHWCFDSDADAA